MFSLLKKTLAIRLRVHSEAVVGTGARFQFERIAAVPTFNVPVYVGIRAGYWNEVEITNLDL
ncbi:hypothetical protein [Nostoc flagelliforme]|uniref:hypothetical protein n=1 Tax=Nostoc flagelliforme TaxID=1306274 RepID=UPI0012FE4E93